MAQIFHRSANTLSRVTIFGAIFIAGFVLWVIGGIVRSPYFTNQGVARVQPVPFVYQASPLTMEWCLNCHRHPEKYVRPREEVFNMAYVPKNQAELGPQLVKQYN